MDRLRFGPAGVPLSSPQRSSLAGVKKTKELGLDAMELEFVRGVKMGEEMAREVGALAEKLDIVLTAHAPYYINLNAREESKRRRSVDHIKAALRALDWAGGYSVVFHAGYYMGEPPEKVGKRIGEEIGKIVKWMEEEGIEVYLRPETTGKPTQWGDLLEILKLSQEFDKVLPCVDFAHLHARHRGKFNSREEWRWVFEKIEEFLSKEALREMHIHISGIHYSEKGELNHLDLEESDLRWRELVEVWKEFDIKGVVISESPNIEGDAMLVRDYWKSL